ncbi:hypothetical protein WL05_22880 [Burkholderia ubonensis]|uniref:hypothetical protein n=1 Tax=Burkholderia ubonensis TaxID=101571 RepID=UPI00075C0F23|nr:hypothetical protein [Burkholderia ubonensis]KVX44171.1 hypothetical protein WL05_22880 [Burkholderia ubonensis]
MSNSTTLLDTISSTQAMKEVVANGLYDAMSPASLWGRRMMTTGGLTWGYFGGNFVDNTGTSHAIANGTLTLTASATNYVYADNVTGAVSFNTTGFPAGKVPLYSVVTNASQATSYLDYRSYQPSATGGGAGTVTSVGLSMPTQFSVANSPVTSSGTLAVTWANATANQVLAGPASGAAAAPTIRALVGADIPPFTGSGASHTTGGVPDPGATAGTTRFLREDSTWAVPPGSGGGGGTVTSVGGTGGVETDQASGAAITSSGSVRANLLPSVVTSAHTFVTGDRGAAIITNSSSAVTQTLPAATGSSGNFPNGWFCDLTSIGTGTTTVAVPSGAQLDGVTNGTIALSQFGGVRAFTDGTNWFTRRGAGSSSSGGMTLIGSQVLSSAASTVTFSSIPQTYNRLMLKVYGRTTSSGTSSTACNVQFNGDTANHNSVATQINGSPSSNTFGASSNASSAYIGDLTQNGNGAGLAAMIELTMDEYASTTFCKEGATRCTFSTFNSASGTKANIGGGVAYNSTSAITSMVLSLASSDQFGSGTIFRLYGL